MQMICLTSITVNISNDSCRLKTISAFFFFFFWIYTFGYDWLICSISLRWYDSNCFICLFMFYLFRFISLLFKIISKWWRLFFTYSFIFVYFFLYVMIEYCCYISLFSSIKNFECENIRIVGVECTMNAYKSTQ